jgi:hypothetical protein
LSAAVDPSRLYPLKNELSFDALRRAFLSMRRAKAGNDPVRAQTKACRPTESLPDTLLPNQKSQIPADSTGHSASAIQPPAVSMRDSRRVFEHESVSEGPLKRKFGAAQMMDFSQMP